MMIGVRTPKPTSTHSEAAGSNPSTGGGDKEETDYFENEHFRRKDVGKEQAYRYRNIANENERTEQISARNTSTSSLRSLGRWLIERKQDAC